MSNLFAEIEAAGGGPDLQAALELACRPDLDAERQAAARRLILDACGPYADILFRICAQCAADRRVAAELHEQLARLQSGVRLTGIVTGIENGHVRVSLGGVQRLLPRPGEFPLAIGQTAHMDGKAETVLAGGDFVVGGQSYAYAARLEGRLALVRSMQSGAASETRQLAIVAESVDIERLRPEDHVLCWSLDAGNLVLLTRHLGAERPEVHDHGPAVEVERDDIIGLDDILDEVDLLFLTADSPAAAAMLKAASRSAVGLLLHGPAGCGKSMVADYAATRVRRGGGTALQRTGSHYLSKWVGEGAERMRRDFEFLDASFAETGQRPLLVVDEIEAIALDRTQATVALGGGHLDVLDTLLSLLTRTEARMIGISNVANRYVDTALMRAGRLRLISFPAVLQPAQVAALFAKRLAAVPLHHNGGPR